MKHKYLKYHRSEKCVNLIFQDWKRLIFYWIIVNFFKFFFKSLRFKCRQLRWTLYHVFCVRAIKHSLLSNVVQLTSVIIRNFKYGVFISIVSRADCVYNRFVCHDNGHSPRRNNCLIINCGRDESLATA